MMRSTKLNQEVISNVEAALQTGISRSAAAYIGRISESTFYNWYNQAIEVERRIEEEGLEEKDLSEQDVLLLEFLERVQRAEAEWEAKMVHAIESQGEEKWLLARRKRQDWGNHFEIDHNHRGDTVVQLEMPGIRKNENGTEP